LLSFFSIANG